MKWNHVTYQSGTQVVSPMTDSICTAHFHIGHVQVDNEGDHLRHQVGIELTAWLNGGLEPPWLGSMERSAPDTVTLPNGCPIRATGPMVDRATPPAWGNWAEDDSADGRIARGLMADALMKRDRALLEKAIPEPHG